MAPNNRNRHIEIVIDHDDDLRKKYLTSPNALHRGERDADLGVDYRGLTMRARCMLAALLTMSTGHRCDRAAIEAIAWELGGDALDGVLWELRSRGYLRIRQVNGEGGKFTYTWGVSRRGRRDWAEEETAERAARRRRAGLADVSAGESMGGKSAHGSDSDDSDETMGGSPRHGEPPSGQPRRGEGGSYREERPPVKKDQGEELPPPPRVAAVSAARAPDDRSEEEGGEQLSQDQMNRASAVLDAIFDAAHVPMARRPRGRKRTTLVHRLAGRIAASWTDADLVDFLSADRFTGVTSVFAVLSTRIADLGDPPRAAQSAPARPETESTRRDPGPRCSKRGHDRQPASGCALCHGELKGRSDGDVALDDAALERGLRFLPASRRSRPLDQAAAS